MFGSKWYIGSILFLLCCVGEASLCLWRLSRPATEKDLIQKQIHQQRNFLSSLGGHFQKTLTYENGKPLAPYFAQGYGKALALEVYKVVNAPKAQGDSPDILVFLHFDFEHFLKILKTQGYSLRIDLSMREGLIGYADFKNKTLFVNANAKWTAFIHEFQHMLVQQCFDLFHGFEIFEDLLDIDGPDQLILRYPEILALQKLGLEWNTLVTAVEAGFSAETAHEKCAEKASVREGMDQVEAAVYAGGYVLRELHDRILQNLEPVQYQFLREYFRALNFYRQRHRVSHP